MKLSTSVHLASPAVVVLTYCVASLRQIFKSKKKQTSDANDEARWAIFRTACLSLTALVMTTFVAESILLACVLPSHAATTADDTLVFTLFSSLAWLILLLGIIDRDPREIIPIFPAAWICATAFDIAVLILDMMDAKVSGTARIFQVVFQVLRLTLLLALGILALSRQPLGRTEKSTDEEIAPLLARINSRLSLSATGPTNKDTYGAAQTDANKKNGAESQQPQAENGDEDRDSDDEEEDDARNGKFKKDWWVYTKAFAVFLPHLWPKKSVRLQLHFPALVLCVLACRGLNVLGPLQLGYVVNALRDNDGRVPWASIGVFILIQLLDSSAGISLAQSWLWLPINRYATEELSTAAYDKIMNLSSDFHDSKKSGRTWRIVGRGESLTDLVYTVGFEIVPMAADLVIAISVFWWLFDAYVAFIVAVSSVLFLWATAKTIPIKTDRQRKFIKAWEDEYTQMTESSSNWTTVSYFNRIQYEQNRYKEAVKKSQQRLIHYRALSYMISALRGLTLQIGLMIAAMLAAFQICKGRRQVGDFVVLITYWSQLSLPLSYFASGFSRIAKALVDAEKLLELLQKEASVGDAEGALAFIPRKGRVDFDNVSFSYDGRRQVVNNLSFRVEPGHTVALVGETGGGKSTILKLLFRFYDVTDGSVLIDGQNVRHVTLESLRSHLGCVPQDPVLFNQTILQNLRYAKLDATDEEIHDACKAVALHDKIMSFTKTYYEKVGERGVKLSGGELQRMAIARAILKDPKILLLDEATSSVDSETEAVIQASLRKLCAGRTTFVIAHRLSTIVHADLVMVIKDGRVVERGTHDRLLRNKGYYSKLWLRQLRLHTGEEASASQDQFLGYDTPPADYDMMDSGDDDSLHLARQKGDSRRSSTKDDSIKDYDEASSDAKDRGRRPSRTDRARGKFDSLRRKMLKSKSPKPEGDSEAKGRMGRSVSRKRKSLKPDAPEFFPQSTQDKLFFSDGKLTKLSSSMRTDNGTEKAGRSSERHLLQSVSREPSLIDNRDIKNGNSPSGGWTDGGPPTADSFSSNGRTGNEAGNEKQLYNSRRNISKSEPQGDYSSETDNIDRDLGKTTGLSARRRSSDPHDASNSTSTTLVGERDGGAPEQNGHRNESNSKLA